MDGSGFGTAPRSAAEDPRRHGNYSGDSAARSFYQYLGGKTAWQDTSGSAAGAYAESHRALGSADGCGAADFTGDFWSAESAGDFSGTCGSGPDRGAERFHRGFFGLVCTDAEERNTRRSLGGDQRRDRRSDRDRVVPHGAAGNGKLDRLGPSDWAARDIYQQLRDRRALLQFFHFRAVVMG